jgi:hypothetical protein
MTAASARTAHVGKRMNPKKVVGRASGAIRLTVCDDTRQVAVQPEVEAKTRGCSVLCL